MGFIVFFIFLKIYLVFCEKGESLFFLHTVLNQQYYYDNLNSFFNNSFIDFNNFTIYKIDKEKIEHDEENELNFNWAWKRVENDKIEITVYYLRKGYERIQFSLDEHTYVKFFFDYQIVTNGGILAYILILFGFFTLARGYIYYNCSIVFYCMIGFNFLILEFCELLEIKSYLKPEDFQIAVYYIFFFFTPIIGIFYGMASYYYDIMQSVAFGFLVGSVINKIIFYLILIPLLNNDINLFNVYTISEIIFVITFILLFFFFKKSHTNFNIICLNLIGANGIIIGINILVGGLPFIPYLILLREYKEEKMFSLLLSESLYIYYLIFYFVLVACGFYSNKYKYSLLKSIRMKRIKSEIGESKISTVSSEN